MVREDSNRGLCILHDEHISRIINIVLIDYRCIYLPLTTYTFLLCSFGRFNNPLNSDLQTFLYILYNITAIIYSYTGSGCNDTRIAVIIYSL